VKTKTLRKNKVNVITLGCSKNLVDSEVIGNQLKANDFDVEHESKDTDREIVIINTCGFIANAKEQSVNTILDAVEAKKEGLIEKVYVTGCLSQRYKDDLIEEIPEVDAFFGTRDVPNLLKTLNADYKHELVGERLLGTPSHYAYLKISEGCDKQCSFCAIPLMRGKHVSKPIEECVKEAEGLAANGVKEIMLIAQELNYYGQDLYKERKLADLINALSEVEGIEWIRLHYAYPSKFPEEVFDIMNENPKLCKYIDIPLQHISDKMLKSMRRATNKETTWNIINNLRERVPGIAIRTTLIAGFPGETEEDFQELIDFIEEAQLDRVGAFTYSHEENTHAFTMEDDVSEEEKQDRVNRIMEIQSGISYEKNQERVGKSYKVLFDKVEGGYFVGRTEFDSPDVDNEVLVPTEGNFARIGDFAMVEITDATEFDLFGKIVD
jgi:ribosomal protein S12 methylthiotransferase